MWGWRAAETKKAACGVETSAGHKSRKEQEQGGREDQKRGSKRLGKWEQQLSFKKQQVHIWAEQSVLPPWICKGAQTSQNLELPPKASWREGEDLKMAPVTPQRVSAA